MSARTETARNGVYITVVRSVFGTLAAASIMSVGYVLSFAAMSYDTGNRVLAAFAAIGVLSGAVRIAVLLLDRAAMAAPALGIERARKIERRFAIAYYQFAVLLGTSSAYVFALADPRVHVLMMCLIVGYGAGAAAGIGLRPWIALPSMAVAIVPAIVGMALQPDAVYWVAAAMTSAMLLGGAHSVLDRYATTANGIAQRLTFETLARQDVLTALPNRLALREWFEQEIAAGAHQRLLAVHCLDLDDFKPVNDVFGHPAGDSLLKEIAERMRRTLGPGDIAARLGGDEFVVIQRGIRDEHDAAALGQRLRAAVAEPFWLQGHEIRVSACIGYIVCDPVGTDLDDLLGLADQALYSAKNSDTGLEYNAIGLTCGPRLVA